MILGATLKGSRSQILWLRLRNSLYALHCQGDMYRKDRHPQLVQASRQEGVCRPTAGLPHGPKEAS